MNIEKLMRATLPADWKIIAGPYHIGVEKAMLDRELAQLRGVEHALVPVAGQPLMWNIARPRRDCDPFKSGEPTRKEGK